MADTAAARRSNRGPWIIAGGIVLAAVILFVAQAIVEEPWAGWIDFATVLSLIGMVIGLLWNHQQLRLATEQMNRTATAAEAARRSIEHAERRMAANQALLLLPQLRMLEGQLEAAVVAGQSREGQIALVQWRDVASQLISFISRQPEPNVELLDALDRSIDVVSRAKASLFEQDTQPGVAAKPMGEVTRRAQSEMAKVCVLVAKMTETFIAETQAQEADDGDQ